MVGLECLWEWFLEFLLDFGVILERNRKSTKIGKSGHYQAPSRNVGNPRRGVDLHQGVRYPHRGEAEVPNWHPSGYATM